MEFLTSTKIKIYNPSSHEEIEIKSFEGLSINENINDPVKTFSFTALSLSDEYLEKIEVGSEVKIYHGKKGEEIKHIFTGIIKETPKKINGILRSFEFSGSDYLGKFQDLIINRSYEDKNIKDIILDLWDYKGKKWVNLGFIEETSYDLTIKFKDLHLYECLEKLSGILDFIFYVDKDKNLHFHSRYLKQSDKTLEKNMFHKGSANFSRDLSRLVNVLEIYGGNRLSFDFTEFLIADGLNDTFSTKYKPRASSSGKIEIYELDEFNNRVYALKLGVEGLHTEGFDAYLNYNEKTIKFDVLPQRDKKYELVYRYERRLRTRISRLESIAKYGEFEDKISFSEIDHPIALKDRGNLHLDKYSDPLIVGSIKPFYNDYEVSESILVYIPELEINHFLQITEKNLSFSPNSVDIDLKFEQKPPISRVIKNILQRITELENKEENEIVEVFETINDEIVFLDFFTFKEKIGGFIIGKNKIGDLIGYERELNY